MSTKFCVQHGSFPEGMEKCPSCKGENPETVVEKKDLKSTTYVGTRLVLSELMAGVVIETNDSEDRITVFAEGDEDLVEDLIVTEKGDQVRVSLPKSQETQTFFVGGGTISITGVNSGSVIIDGVKYGQDEKELQLHITVPKNVDIHLDNPTGSVSMPDIFGELRIDSSNRLDVQAGDVRSLRLRVKSLGSVNVGEVSDASSLFLSGSSSLSIRKLTADDLKVKISSIGGIDIGELIANDFQAKLSGSGALNLGVCRTQRFGASVSSIGGIDVGSLDTGVVSLKTSGSGSIRIGEIDSGDVSALATSIGKVKIRAGVMSGKFVATSRGSGSIQFAGVAKHAKLKATSIGSIYLGECLNIPEMIKKGSGRVNVGKYG